LAEPDLLAARRAEIDRLEALAQELLDAHPAPKSAPQPGSIDDQVEAEWRELAHARRQMRPLLEAIERAEAGQPEYQKWRKGFDFRLTEAMATVGTLCSFSRVQQLRQRKTARNPRPKAESPFTQFIVSHLKRNPDATAKEIETALVNEAEAAGGGRIELSTDKMSVLTTDDRPRRLKITSIPSAVTKARDKLSAKK
jgi:hypothetical protein